MTNICCLLIFILCKEKIEVCFVSLVSREFHGAESTHFFFQQIGKKNTKRI